MNRFSFVAGSGLTALMVATLVAGTRLGSVAAGAGLGPVIPDDWSHIDRAVLHGTVTPPGAELLEKEKELRAYDELAYGYPALTESELTTVYFKDGKFAPVANPSRVYYPRSDVKIVRDEEWGVPHIYGLTDEAAAYGAGYAAVEDRLPIILALVALGRAEAFELAGDNATWLADFEMARLYGYTEEELQKQIDRLPVVYGQDGQDVVDLLTSLTHGMNAALLGIRTGLLPLPDGVEDLGRLPAPFRTTDVVAIVSIVRALFGAGGGSELANASSMLSLTDQYGPVKGIEIYEDFRNRFSRDGIVHTTNSFPYGAVPNVIDPGSSPFPTLYQAGDPGIQAFFEELQKSFPGGMAQAQAQTADLAEQARIKYENLVVRTPAATIRIPEPGGLSNYVVVDGDVSTTGHPILLGGPQAGYFDPQILVENELHGDRIHARGAGFPGMGFVVIGRNAEAAWTATAGGSDMIDIYVEELCDPAGGEPTEKAIQYLFDGECREMDRRVHRFASEAPVDLPGRELLPDIIVERTVHGPVIARGRIGNKAVAVSRKRSTYMKELDAAIAILRLNRNEVPDGATFVRDFTQSMNFATNWAFANADEIAYVHGGLYPVRPANAHPDLPLWGTGGYEWQQDPGLANVARTKDPATDNDDVYLSDLAGPDELSKHPHEVAPPRHYTVSWNNRPAPDWSASDAQWGYSSVYRADLLEDLVQHEIAEGRKISPVRLVQIMEHAGLTDLRGSHVVPQALQALASATDTPSPEAAARIAMLQAWSDGWTDFANADGPLRRDGDRDGEYDDAAAAGIMDAWWEPMIHAMFDAGLDGRGVDTVSRQGFHNAPGSIGSAFQGGFYGQVRADLDRVLGNPILTPTSQIYCGSTGVGVDGDLVSCANALLASLESIDPGPANALSERILFLPTAVLSMHWVNRPTTQVLATFGP